MEINKIHHGDVITLIKQIPDNSIDCIVTSPPYFGLRDYDVEGQIGLESTVQEYIDKLVNLFEECRRTLKSTGTFWLNIGDTYSNYKDCKSTKQTISSKEGVHEIPIGKSHSRNSKLLKSQGFKNKELMNVPHRLVLALSDAGWYHRQTIVWAKATSGEERRGSCMPESVNDRLTQSFEYIFLLTKKDKYYFDSHAIKEPLNNSSISRLNQDIENQTGTVKANGGQKTNGNFKAVGDMESGLANMRNVWRINLQPGSSGQHIAGFPEKIPFNCIKAGSSERGCCAECGKPYKRLLENDGVINHSWSPGTRDQHKVQKTQGNIGSTSSLLTDQSVNYISVGWEKSCNCETDEIVPSIILDPFMGSGTTAKVALELNRNFVGFELNEEYLTFANNRIAQLLNSKTFF